MVTTSVAKDRPPLRAGFAFSPSGKGDHFSWSLWVLVNLGTSGCLGLSKGDDELSD